MKALTPARRDQLASVRRNLGKLEDASWGMQYLASGGGTMWSQMATAATATREEFLGSLITSMAQRQQPQPAARRRAMTLFNKARRKLDAFKKAPEHDSGPFSPAEQKKEHTQRWNEASAALQHLQKLLPVCPMLLRSNSHSASKARSATLASLSDTAANLARELEVSQREARRPAVLAP
jgi:hypothetical protein